MGWYSGTLENIYEISSIWTNKQHKQKKRRKPKIIYTKNIRKTFEFDKFTIWRKNTHTHTKIRTQFSVSIGQISHGNETRKKNKKW